MKQLNSTSNDHWIKIQVIRSAAGTVVNRDVRLGYVNAVREVMEAYADTCVTAKIGQWRFYTRRRRFDPISMAVFLCIKHRWPALTTGVPLDKAP